ncbi:unnamed protein product [Alopecurus aequalis]
MWPYSVARSLPLLSHLRRPPRCIGDAVIAAVGCANRRVTDRAYASGTAFAPEVDNARPHRHLYVVLDQINAGHGIYKLNIDDLDGGDEEALTGAGMDADKAVPPPPCRLPEAVLRLGVSSVGSHPQFKGLGSKIVIIGDYEYQQITYIYDTKTAKLDTAKPPADNLCLGRMSSSVSEKLHLITAPGESPQYLCEVPAAPELDQSCLSRREEDNMISSKWRGQLQRWAWKSGPTPPPLPEGASISHFPLQSYAVHPNGQTIFFSSRYFTFSLDTNGADSARRVGEWVLPFHGRAYYDPDLDAWIGMRKVDSVEEGLMWERHYLCSCDVPAAVVDNNEGNTLPLPALKMCKEELTFFDPPLADYRVKHTLVHTGRGRFCLVEAAPTQERKGTSHCTCTNDGIEHVLLVTMFRAKHGKNGELVVAPCRPGRSYIVPNYLVDCNSFADSLSAFWM